MSESSGVAQTREEATQGFFDRFAGRCADFVSNAPFFTLCVRLEEEIVACGSHRRCPRRQERYPAREDQGGTLWKLDEQAHARKFGRCDHQPGPPI
jgi:hypothetical protein